MRQRANAMRAEPELARTFAVVLAAGASKRLGQPKQLLSCGTQTLVAHTVAEVCSAHVDHVTVVLGAHAESVRQALVGFPKIHFVFNPHFANGLSASIHAGLQSLVGQGDLSLNIGSNIGKNIAQNIGHDDRILLATADQPGVTSAHLNRLIAAVGGARPGNNFYTLAASAYAGRLGVPAVFAGGWLEALLALEGDSGARSVILQAGKKCAQVACPEAAFDVDTPADVAELLKIYGIAR